MESTEARPIRILAEYLDPLRRFKAHNIQDTVVFFGSARVLSRTLAQRNLTRLEERRPIRERRTTRRRSSAAARRSSGRGITRTRGRSPSADEVEHVARSAAAPLRRLLRRRPRHHGSGQPRREGSGREIGRPEHPPAVRAGAEPVHHRRISSSTSTTSSCGSSGSPTSPRRW